MKRKTKRQLRMEGMEKDLAQSKMTDREILAGELENERLYLETDNEFYLECLNNKPLAERVTDLEVRDGLILYWHVYRHIRGKN
jgi:hypothetical protein